MLLNVWLFAFVPSCCNDMSLLYILLSFVTASLASESLTAALAKHLNMHQFITVVDTLSLQNNAKILKSLSKEFILSQVFEPAGFRKVLSGLNKQTLIQISTSSLLKQVR